MNIEKLKKWEIELNTCIRCGYCYENCHMFKLTNWESDTPRGKLVLAYGLLKGELQPTEAIAEKIFECFTCKQCEKSCSAKVPVTEIFNDLREMLIEEGFIDVLGTVAQVDEDLCSGCGLCVSVCKPEATTLENKPGGGKIAKVDKAKCQSCGICIPTCPSGARKIKEGYLVSPKELESAVRDRLQQPPSPEPKPEMVVFSCNWSTVPGLRLSNLAEENGATIKPVVTMCTGRLDPILFIKAFMEGAWGILIASCPLDECEHDGNYRMINRVALIREVMNQFNIEPERVRIDYIGTNETAKLQNAITAFHDELVKLGPVKPGIGSQSSQFV